MSNIIDLETSITILERNFDDLNEVVVRQQKLIDFLLKQHEHLLQSLNERSIKSQSEETPPPHY